MTRIIPKLVLLAMFISGCSHFHKLAWVMSSNPSPGNPQSIARGKKVFKLQCVTCHGERADGQGPTANLLKTNPTNLILAANKRSDSSFAGHVAYGKFGNPEMPQFRDTLSDEQIWDVTNYVYSLK